MKIAKYIRKKTSLFITLSLLLSAVCLLSAQNKNLVDDPTSDEKWINELANRVWQGIPGIERTAGGRLFFTWFTGGEVEPREENMVILCYSDDDGRTHSPIKIMAVPPVPGARCYDPTPWIDPKGRLWYIFCRGSRETAEHGVYARICDDPDALEPVFGPEFRIGFDDVPFSFRMNKPTVLSTGEWIMPVTYSKELIYAWNAGRDDPEPRDGFSNQPVLHGVSISYDEGKTWSKLHGEVDSPPWALENMIIELKDGRLWMLVRTNAGFLWESFSTDKGITWSEGKRSNIITPGSRFFIRRLSSGNLLLVNHTTNRSRTNIRAQISVDDGKTWSRGLLLDNRPRISYPDGVEDAEGNIWIIYDFDRNGRGDERTFGQMVMARFREEDAMRGRDVSKTVVLRYVVNSIPMERSIRR